VPEPPLPAHAQDKRRLETLLSRTWALAREKEHPLGRLQGLPLGPYRLLALLGPKNNVGARYLQLFLVDSEGRMSEEPVAFGLHNSGPYPGYNWAEVIRYEPSPRFRGEAVDLRSAGLEEGLFQALAGPGPVIAPLFSPRTAQLLRDARLPPHASLQIVAMSAAIANVWNGIAPVMVVPAPTAVEMCRAVLRAASGSGGCGQ